jgi:hypothetical protein
MYKSGCANKNRANFAAGERATDYEIIGSRLPEKESPLKTKTFRYEKI